jgi:UDP-N-acetylglucosamine kinase
MPSEPLDLLRHKLPATEHARIFRQQIVPHELAGAIPQDDPVVLFVAGQTGAGKSTLAEETTREWTRADGPPAHICGDIYKPYHPDYAALRARDPRTAGAYTRLDSRQWHAAAECWVIARRCDAVVEIAPSCWQDFAGVAQGFRAAGFRIEFAAIAVPAAESRLAIIRRFLETGRYVAASNHDATSDGLLQTAEAIDRKLLCDRTTVVRRGGAEAYANQPAAGQWRQPPGFAAAIRAIRSERWSESRSIAFCAELNDTAQRVARLTWQGAPALRADLARIAELAAEVSSPSAPLERAAQGRLSLPFRPSAPVSRPLGGLRRAALR